MSGNTEQETKAFMTAYQGLKSASQALEAMSHDPEPDLDKMLAQVKRAKLFYDQCNQVIEDIKAQVESIFSGSTRVAANEIDRSQEQVADVGEFGAPILARAGSTSGRGDMDDEIPF